jgi:hypothetical protein
MSAKPATTLESKCKISPYSDHRILQHPPKPSSPKRYCQMVRRENQVITNMENN